MFTVTAAAAQQIIKAAHDGGAEGMALRLAARRNDDGSIDYRMGFDTANDEDISSRSEGIEIVIAPEYITLLDTAVMDFVTLDDGNQHFIFLNPKDPSYRPPLED